METNKTGATNILDLIKWVVVIALIAVGVVGNAYYSEESLLYRVLALLGLAVVAAFVAFQTTKGASLWQLIKESRNEIRKVVWPTNQETTQTTLIVFAFVAVCGLLLWAMDSAFSWAISKIIG